MNDSSEFNVTEEKLQKSSHKDSLVFIKEVAKYFMDFLETDFHKRKNPKRSVQLRNSKNLLIGLNLNKYTSFNTIIWKTINHAFDKNILNAIQKGIYRTIIPVNLIKLVSVQLEKITEDQLKQVLGNISQVIEQSANQYKNDYDQALNTALELTTKIVKTNLVLPYIRSIEVSLTNSAIVDENGIYLMEEELTNVLVYLLEGKISEIIKNLLGQKQQDISKLLGIGFDIQQVKNNIISFFENFQIGDLFAEVYEIERNRTILDKQEFYLYFCDIHFNNVKYPIFYIPFSIEKKNDLLQLEFDSQIYINKKALEYITQEYNQQRDKKGNLKTITDRIIYLANCKNNLNDILVQIISEITNFFDLDKSIDLTNPNVQVSKSLLVKVSNACYIALYDKSDEALINDYEEILQLLNAKDNVLAEAFNKLIDDFIHKNPKSFNSLVEKEWDDLKTNDRLVFSSPIPLNCEQLQILSAIRKKECKYIIVEGPPGTGKSHTITAVVFNSVLENQSVLVLSDKKEALDVVEDKIAEAINKVRKDRNFQNPILRLGKTGSTYSQILSTSAIENIKSHYKAVSRNYDTLSGNIEKSKNSLNEDLEAEILANEDIDIKEIYELFALEAYFEKNGFPIDITETNENQEVAEQFENLRSILANLKIKLDGYDSFSNPHQERLDLLINKVKGTTDFLEKFIQEHKQSFVSDDFIETIHKNTPTFDMIYELFSFEKPKQSTDVSNILKSFLYITKSIDRLKSILGTKLTELVIPASFSDSNFMQIQWFINQYENLKVPIFGYLFCGKKLEELNLKFIETFKANKLASPHKQLKTLKEINSICSQINEYKKDFLSIVGEKVSVKVDFVNAIITLVRDDSINGKFNELLAVISAFDRFKTISDVIHHKTKIEIIDDFINENNLSNETELLRRYHGLLEVIS